MKNKFRSEKFDLYAGHYGMLNLYGNIIYTLRKTTTYDYSKNMYILNYN